MKGNKWRLTFFSISFLFLSGCAAVNPLVTHYENSFSGFTASPQGLQPPAGLTVSVSGTYGEVWNSALYILVQEGMIIDVSKETGTITYVSIDGVYFGDVFPEDSYYYWEFPFTVFITGEDLSVKVSVSPMSDLYDQKDRGKLWWKIVQTGFHQKGEAFLQKLTTQLTVHDRWQWLRK